MLKCVDRTSYQQVLQEEAVARRRRASFDESGNPLRAPPETSAGDGTEESEAAPENYGASFLSSLPYDLRVEALLSADEAFIASLPAAIQAEARQLHQEHSSHMGGGGGLFRLAGWDEENDQAGAAEDSRNEREEGHREEDAAVVGGRSRRGGAVRVPVNTAAVSATSSSSANALETACLRLEDDITPMRSIPFGRQLPTRLLLHLYTTRRARLSRPLLRLMVSICKHSVVRKPIMRAIMSLLVSDRDGLVSSLQALQHRDTLAPGTPSRQTSSSSSDASPSQSLSRDALALVNADQIDTVTPVTLRRLLNALYYLCKKSDKLCWYDLMSQSCGGETGCNRTCLIHEKWIFGQLLSLLAHPGFGSNANIDMVLHVMQDILEPLSSLSIATVNALVARQGNLPSPEQETTSQSSTVAESRRTKRVRIDPIAVEFATDTQPSEAIGEANTTEDAHTESGDGSGQRVAGIISSATRIPYKASTAGPILRIKCDMPFPVIDDACAAMLTGVVQYEECGGVFPSRLGRILTTLSLHDANWMKLLECLRVVAEEVAVQTTAEARNIQQILAEIIDKNGDAAVAMALPHLSTPSTVSELRLLHVLRLITSLRTASNEESEDTATVAPTVNEVTDVIRKIDFLDLWDSLVGILDLVRQLEGIREQELVEADEEMGGSAAVEPAAIPALSSLTMRFVPLIECFLTVCGSCVLRKPEECREDTSTEDVEGAKRKGSPSVSSEREGGCQGHDVTQSPSQKKPTTLFSTNMQMPGTRFRRHSEFRRMQQELDDTADSRRLLRFVQSNTVLLNMVLKQNVNLLESSFAPLIQIPRCRALLHFDIKRAFFKMKLKRMKRNSRYQDMTTRLKVYLCSVSV